MLRRSLRFMVAGLLIGLLAAGTAAALLPRAYSAQSTLFLQVQFTGATLKSRAEFAIERVQSYPPLLQSPALLQQVVDDLGLPMTAEQLAQHVTAESPTGTSLLTVTATADTPAVAAAIANDAGKQLIAKVSTLESGQVTGSNNMHLLQVVVAKVPAAPSSPNVPVLLGLGALAGVVLGYLLTLLLDAVRPPVGTVEDVRRVTGLPVVGEVPAHVARRRSALALTPEAVSLAANVRAITRGEVPPVLLLVPVGRRAARSAVRYVLARGLEVIGTHPVVVEADASIPLPRAVEVPEDAPGLSLLLTDSTADVVLHDAVERLDVIAAGDPALAPDGPRLERGARAALAALAAAHDVVVVQTAEGSAPLPAKALASSGPGTLLVVSSASTQRELRDALVRLRAAGIEPVGVLLLDTSRIRPVDVQETWRDDDLVTLRRDTPSELDAGELAELVRSTGAPSQAPR